MREGGGRVTIPAMRPNSTSRLFRLCLMLWLALSLSACVRPAPGSTEFGTPLSIGADEPDDTAEATPVMIEEASSDPVAVQLGTPVPTYVGQPTADAAHYDVAPAAGSGTTGSHTIAAGETLGTLAQRYETSIDELMTLNGLSNPDVIHVGQTLQVPGVEIQQVISPEFKIIPNSELVYGPSAAGFDLAAFVTALDGRLVDHQEQVEGQMMSGPAIVQLLADRYSVNPRLMLAIVEHQTGWVTGEATHTSPTDIGYRGNGQSSFYVQLSWAANMVNLGFYGRAEGGLRSFNLGADTQVTLSPRINDATAGVQRFFAAVDGMTYDEWQREVGPDGLFATYNRLFGNPFAYTYEPILPAALTPPEMELPWADGETWYYTGGPHGAWNSGSAWGALDFVPPAEQAGCYQSEAWVTSMTDGTVVRSGHGAVVVDLDGDGYAGTGWAITYMHLETRDRAPLGTEVKTGDRLGHPSCEGGFSNGTHLHIARSYNGRWISADGEMPFEMSGWVSSGAGAEYDGYLTRGEAVRGACVCREEVNAVAR